MIHDLARWKVSINESVLFLLVGRKETRSVEEQRKPTIDSIKHSNLSEKGESQGRCSLICVVAYAIDGILQRGTNNVSLGVYSPRLYHPCLFPQLQVVEMQPSLIDGLAVTIVRMAASVDFRPGRGFRPNCSFGCRWQYIGTTSDVGLKCGWSISLMGGCH
jgi:hypothetical protein